MGNCRLAIFNIDKSLTILSCDDVKLYIEKMKSDFRKINRVDQILESGGIDHTYNEYCEKLDNFLSKCNCKISLHCEKCSVEDHENNFCRCKRRNILLAKQLRKDAKNKLKDNKGQVMEYEYEGKKDSEFEGYILLTDIPKEKWEFGTEINAILKKHEENLLDHFPKQPERLNPEDAKSVCDSLNIMET